MGTAREWYGDHDLPFPPVPVSMEERLEERGDTMWATAGASEPLWDTKRLAMAAAEQFPEPQAAIGATGRGLASNALYCTIVTHHVAAFVEHGWGNVGDDDQVVADIGVDYSILALILDKFSARAEQHTGLVILKSTLRLDAAIFHEGQWTQHRTYDVLHRALDDLGHVA
jgi:hypothetical protein